MPSTRQPSFLRPLHPSDLPDVLRIQRACYVPALLESGEAFAAKLALFPAGAIGAVVENDLADYLFCHPWLTSQIVPLDQPLTSLPPHPDCLYLHDLAIYPDHRRRGLARRLLQAAFDLGQNLKLSTFCLVAVQGSQEVWSRYGFRPVETFDYAPGVLAVRMVRSLS